ncbi:MAG TPA: ABC transporter permease [Gemmatimonadaceae bacterium]|nr:ABC transporter permease [Gemmatimonadaceae bacterium]
MIDGSSNWARWWSDIVAYRGALYSLALRNIRSRYKQAVLGIAWAVLQPLLQVAVFTVVFSRIAGADPGGIPYPVFALAGLIPWNVLSKIITDGSTSLAVNQHIITKLFFPRIYLVISAGTSALVDAIVGVVLLGGLMALYGIAPAKTVLLALPALGAVMLLGFGLSALLAAVNARWRDVQHTIPFLLQIGLLATPIVYPPAVVSGRWQWLLALNPVTAIVAAFRSAVLGLPLPPEKMMVSSLAVSLGAVIVGLWYFTRAERTIVDVV